MRGTLLACATLLLSACARWPASYAPPDQFPTFEDPPVKLPFLTMNQPETVFSNTEGVVEAGRGWGFKWTLPHARFHLTAGDLTGADFFMRYAMDPRTLRDRGPVKVTIAIDGRPFDSFVEGVVGEHVHRHPAAQLTGTNTRTLDVALTVDPPWIGEDGTQLGIFLDAIGFVRRP